jgi:hypothetical protein
MLDYCVMTLLKVREELIKKRDLMVSEINAEIAVLEEKIKAENNIQGTEDGI